MFRDRRFFRAVEVASILVFLDPHELKQEMKHLETVLQLPSLLHPRRKPAEVTIREPKAARINYEHRRAEQRHQTNRQKLQHQNGVHPTKNPLTVADPSERPTS